ncbi:response regulator [Cryomorpha ignava]|uniref:Response regulator n=1 Tax=Cryomorpha ignava TaxID=101383 RepID=A0A7K3WU34_9FLAO|nr:response regulator [Cryomorpha ignava]NEN24996.1 response regulator [Cryomorpha ignava]
MNTRILICDDDVDMVKLISRMLTKNGYDVDEITQMVDFMDKVQKFDPDMILMDISMPDINGVDATRMLYANESTSYIPVIFMSADPDIELFASQLNKLYIKKPFDIDKLRAILNVYSIQ